MGTTYALSKIYIILFFDLQLLSMESSFTLALLLPFTKPLKL